MQEKGAIKETNNVRGQFISNLFLVEKKDGGNRPVINLKQSNKIIPYLHFKMEDLVLLKEMLSPADYMCKIDLKDAYFAVPLSKQSRKYVCFLSIRIPLSVFWNFPSPTTVHQALESSYIPPQETKHKNYYVSRRYAANGSNERQITDGFLVNIKKSVLEPTRQLEFLGVTINSLEMSFSLAERKIMKIMNQCQKILDKDIVSVREVSKLIGTLVSTAVAILPAPL